jgi:hypothetical protein
VVDGGVLDDDDGPGCNEVEAGDEEVESVERYPDDEPARDDEAMGGVGLIQSGGRWLSDDRSPRPNQVG